MKCDICKETIKTTFLNKPIGTHIKNIKKKKCVVCASCQKKFATKEKMLEQIK